MESYSAAVSTQTSSHYKPGNNSPSDDPTRDIEAPPIMLHETRERTPAMAVINFDGDVRVVRANSLHRSCADKQLLTFLFHCAALVTAVVVGLVMMILRTASSSEFGLWSGIFALGIGGFLPEPSLKSGAQIVTNGTAGGAVAGGG